MSPIAKVLTLGLSGTTHAITELPALLQYVETDLATSPHRDAVVVIVRNVPGEHHLELARRLRGLARGSDVAIVALDVPSSVIELTSRVVSGMAASMPADLLPEFARRVAADTATTAVLDSVAKLRNPVPTLGQHARSALPGACFVVTPDQQVVGGREAALSAWQPIVAQATDLRIASACPGHSFTDFLATLTPDTTVVERAEGSRDGYWGARHWLELSWLPASPEAIAEALAREPAIRCTNCGRLTHAEDCSYCAAVTRYISRREAMDQ